MASKPIITLKDQVLIINFKGNKTKMNQTLDCISDAYEGPLRNREGHNFPSTWIPAKHSLLSQYKKQCLYVVAVYNTHDLPHELLHAKYFIDSKYRSQINQEWSAFTLSQKHHITTFLKKLGYTDKVIIDEYQAYRYTEKPNFFGKLISN